MMMTSSGAAAGLCAALLCACTAGEPRTTQEQHSLATTCRATTVEWGTGATQVGFTPGGQDYLGRGPQALALAPSGDVLVLDSMNGRVVSVGVDGAIRVLAEGLPTDVEDLAVGSDGGFAAYSPLFATAWLFDADGAPAGSVAIDRAIRDVTGIGLGLSRQVLVRTALQETFTAGSPAAPVALATQLTGKREGAYQLADGLGLATRAMGGAAQLAVIDSPRGRRATTRAVHAIPGDADAAQLVAATGDLACVRTEHVAQPGDHLEVSRRVVCLNAVTGAVVVDRALAAPGPYLPAHEIALSSSRVAILEPAASSLVIRTCEVSR